MAAPVQETVPVTDAPLLGALDRFGIDPSGVTTWDMIVDTIGKSLTIENVALQILVICISLFCGWVLSRRVNRHLTKVEASAKLDVDEVKAKHGTPEPNDERGRTVKERLEGIDFFDRMKLFGVGFLKNVTFSLFGWVVLCIGGYVLVDILGYDPKTMILMRVASHVLFAFAILSLFTVFINEILGGRVITGGTRKFIVFVFWLLVFLHFFGILDDITDRMQATKVPLGGANVTVWACFVAIITVLFTLALAEWFANMADSLLRRSQLSINLQVAVSRVVRIIFFVVAIMVALSTVGLNLSVLSVFGGALGVGLGFGLQKIASNYISGFIILLDRSVKIGDLVEVAGFKGRVTQINTRFTVVRNPDGIESIVPNENFVTSTVKNYSYTDESSVAYIKISVAYDANVRRALEIMLEEGMRERPRIVKGRKGWAYVDSFGDSGINLALGFWIKDPVNGTSSLRTQIAMAIYERFLEEGIEVPFNRMDLNLRFADAPEVRVRLNEAVEKDAPPVAPTPVAPTSER